MRRTLAAWGHDVKFQIRQGFYLAYLLITVMYSLLLSLVPAGAKSELSVIVIFTDPSALGFFFIGGIVLLEKGQNIYDNLFVTPLQVREYMTAKTLSLAMLSTLSGTAVHVSSFGIEEISGLFLAGIFLTSAFFTLIGLGLAVRYETLNGFFLVSPMYSILFYVPVLGYMKLFDSPLYYLLPTQGTLLLIASPFHPLAAWEMVYGLLVLLIWIGLAYVWAKRSFTNYIVLKIGGGAR
ncbi:ABC transporter permease [Paenibacillus sp. J2TS4]|uniref:fluoroquinolone export ABC transporter permease subunit n=1 Tax=Paenibacillus sp. J2TS4 TaxID=2807194 RepID=UPI001B2447A0|nr:ABC transporter permease [Paenibacillus sp. J2TS4]GIP34693.1 ABC transporter [Paenibacillus sp. J2TS4]